MTRVRRALNRLVCSPDWTHNRLTYCVYRTLLPQWKQGRAIGVTAAKWKAVYGFCAETYAAGTPVEAEP
jgi:hypothetical protein